MEKQEDQEATINNIPLSQYPASIQQLWKEYVSIQKTVAQQQENVLKGQGTLEYIKHKLETEVAEYLEMKKLNEDLSE